MVVDFFLFGTAAALVFPTLFFPGDNETTKVLASFGVFGVGFLARPIGGVVFAHIGDTVGRKKAFIGALGLMAVASFLIGVLPTYASIGLAAPIVLTVLRFCQGLAVGGQWGGAALMATEAAPSHRRGFYGAFAQLGVPIGVLLGLSGYFVLFQTLGKDAFAAYGWRIPFIASIVFVGVVLYTKNKLEDTPAFKKLQMAAAAKTAGQPAVSKSPVMTVLTKHWRQVVLAGGAFIVVNAVFYMYIVFMLDYGVRNLELTHGQVLAPISVATVVLIPALPAWAALSDRIGRLPLYMAGAILTAVWAFPAFWLIDTKSFLGMAASLTVGMVVLAMMYGPLAALFSELFPPEVRYSGASLGYQLGAVIGGAATPLIAVELFHATGTNASLAYLLIALSLVAVICVTILRNLQKSES